MAIGDVDGDGKPDLAVVNLNSNSVSVFRNTGSPGTITTASFAGKVDFYTGTDPNTVILRDLDGDGKIDLAVSNGNGASVSVFRFFAFRSVMSSDRWYSTACASVLSKEIFDNTAEQIVTP